MRAARIPAAFLAAAASLLLAGCLDLYQTITREPSGTIAVYFSATVSRSLMDLVSSMSDSGETLSVDSLLNIEDVNNDREVRALDGTLEKIDDGMNVGFGIKLHIEPGSSEDRAIMAAHDGPMVPDITDTSIVIFFPSLGMETPEDDALAGYVNGYKYRLLISKDVMPTLSSARLTGDAGSYNPLVTTMIDSYLIEIPLTYLLVNHDGCELVIER